MAVQQSRKGVKNRASCATFAHIVAQASCIVPIRRIALRAITESWSSASRRRDKDNGLAAGVLAIGQHRQLFQQPCRLVRAKGRGQSLEPMSCRSCSLLHVTHCAGGYCNNGEGSRVVETGDGVAARGEQPLQAKGPKCSAHRGDACEQRRK